MASKNSHLMWWYKVWDGDQLIYEGLCRDVERKMGCCHSSLLKCSEGKRSRLKFRYIVTRETRGIYRPDYVCEYIKDHLEIYGNTTLNANPEKYRKRLKDEGISFSSRKVINRQDGNHWILTRI